jgi:hypothetical protein
MTSIAPAGRLLISHIPLRGPELAQVYQAILACPELTLDELRSQFCPGAGGNELADAPLRETLSFLTIAGLVQATGRPRRHTATPLMSDVSFPLLLLAHLNTHAEPRQRAISLVHRQLVAEDTLAITPQALRDQLERGPLRDQFAWTGEKIAFWAHLAAFSGLIRRPDRSTELLIVPSLTLLQAALEWAIATHPGETALAALLNAIEARFFACFTARGRVQRGLAQSLLALEQRGQIQLLHHADALHSLLLGERRVSALQVYRAAERIDQHYN